MKLKINAKNYETSVKSLFALRDELGFNSNDISIYKGFATNEDLALNDGDSVVFIKKGELPPKDALKEMMQARISLVWAVKTVLHNALEDILAVSAPERM